MPGTASTGPAPLETAKPRRQAVRLRQKMLWHCRVT
jgi:hypothetical protein